MSSFCYSHFFRKTFQHICISLDVNFNESSLALNNWAQIFFFFSLVGGPLPIYYCVLLCQNSMRMFYFDMPVSSSADSRGVVVSFLAKDVHKYWLTA